MIREAVAEQEARHREQQHPDCEIQHPYRPKRRTRATIAEEKGLEPRADWLLNHQAQTLDPSAEAAKFLVQSDDRNKAVPTVEDSLAGARDIIAERINEDADTRKAVRGLFEQEATISSKLLISWPCQPRRPQESRKPIRSLWRRAGRQNLHSSASPVIRGPNGSF